MMDQSGQSGQIESCQIILIMTWWISQVSQLKYDNVKSYLLRNDGSFRSGQIISIPIEIPHQFVNSLGFWACIGHNLGIFYHNLTFFCPPRWEI